MTELTVGLPDRIHEILERGASHGGDRTAFIDENGERWTYDAVLAAVSAVGSELGSLGVRPGDRVMVVGENCIAFIVLMYALSRLDAWAIMVNSRLGEHEISLIESDCKPRLRLYTHLVSPQADVHADRSGASVFKFGEIGEIRIGPLDEQAAAEPVYEDSARQAAVLIYTTGSTGKPKGVMLSHRNLLYVAQPAVRGNPNRLDDVALCVMPVSHSYGLTLMQGLLYAGSSMRIMPRFDVEKAIELVRSGELTLFFAVPAMLAKVMAHIEATGKSLQPNRIRYAYTGTAPLSLDMRHKIEREFGVVLHNGYGLTETSPTISRTDYAKGTDEISIGKPIPGIEVRIVDAKGRDVGPGETGELIIKGPNVMLGYYNRPAQTAEVMTEDGFLRTGDIAGFDPQGNIVLCGRSKEIIIRSGFNIYPAEIEDVINSHPAILQSAVVGQQVDNNENIVAFVELKPGASVEPSEIIRYVGDNLASYKKPQQVILLDSIPVAPNGKVLKSVLAQRLA